MKIQSHSYRKSELLQAIERDLWWQAVNEAISRYRQRRYQRQNQATARELARRGVRK